MRNLTIKNAKVIATDESEMDLGIASTVTRAISFEADGEKKILTIKLRRSPASEDEYVDIEIA